MRIPNVQFAYLSGVFAGGTSVLVAAVPGKQIRILGYAFTSNTAVNFQLQDTAGNPMTALAQGIIGAGEQGDSVCPLGQSAVGQGLQLSSGAATIGLQVRYEVL